MDIRSIAEYENSCEAIRVLPQMALLLTAHSFLALTKL